MLRSCTRDESSGTPRAVNPEGGSQWAGPPRPHPPTLYPSEWIISGKRAYTGAVTIKHLIKTNRRKFTDVRHCTASPIFPSSYYCYDCYYEIIVILAVRRSGWAQRLIVTIIMSLRRRTEASCNLLFFLFWSWILTHFLLKCNSEQRELSSRAGCQATPPTRRETNGTELNARLLVLVILYKKRISRNMSFRGNLNAIIMWEEK